MSDFKDKVSQDSRDFNNWMSAGGGQIASIVLIAIMALYGLYILGGDIIGSLF